MSGLFYSGHRYGKLSEINTFNKKSCSQIEQDLREGRLDSLLEETKQDLASGRCESL